MYTARACPDRAREQHDTLMECSHDHVTTLQTGMSLYQLFPLWLKRHPLCFGPQGVQSRPCYNNIDMHASVPAA